MERPPPPSYSARMKTDEGEVMGAEPGQPEPQTISATQLREWILTGERVLPKRDGGYLITGDLDLVSVAVEHRVVIQGAVFEGMVDASDARFARSLDLTGCVFQQGLKLERAEVDGALVLEGARVAAGHGLTAPDLRVEGLLNAIELQLEGGDFQAPNARIAGDLRLCGAQLHGALNLTYARFEGELFLRAALQGRPQTFIAGGAVLIGCHISGQVDAGGLRVLGGLNLQGATLESEVLVSSDSITGYRTEIHPGEDGVSVTLAGAKVKGQVHFKGADLKGALIMQGADIEGHVFCQSTPDHRTEIGAGAEKTVCAGQSVSLAGAKVKSQVVFSGADLKGTLNLEKAETGSVFCQRDEKTSGHETAVRGEVMLYGAVINGSFQWQDATVGGDFAAQGLTVHGMFLASGLAVEGAEDLRSASVTEELDLKGVIAAEGADLSHLQLKGKLSTQGALVGDNLNLTHAEVGGEWAGAPAGIVDVLDAWSAFHVVKEAGKELTPKRTDSNKATVAHASAKNTHEQLLKHVRAGVKARRNKPADSRTKRLPAERAMLKVAWSKAQTDLKATTVALEAASAAFEAANEAFTKAKADATRAAVAKRLTGQAETPAEKIPQTLARLRGELEELDRQARGSAEAEQNKKHEEHRQQAAQLDELEAAPALDLRHAEFKGRILLAGEGETPSWVIAGSVNAQRLQAGGDLRLQHVRVRGSLVLEDAQLDGELNLNRTVVGANLNLRSATVKGQLFGPLEPEGVSPSVRGEIRMDSATLAEVKLRLHGPECHPEHCKPEQRVTPLLVSLEHAKVERLVVGGNLPTTHPPHFKLAGLEFRDLNVEELEDGSGKTGRHSVFRWLERSQYEILLAEMADFEEQPYQTVEEWLRGRGRDDDADHLYLARRRRELQLHPLTVWQRLHRRGTGRKPVELPRPAMNLCRWAKICPVLPPYNRKPLRIGWVRWLTNWFLLRTVGFGVRTRTAATMGVLAFLFSWLCVFDTPDAVVRKASRGISQVPVRVLEERAATNRVPVLATVTVTNANGSVTTNKVMTGTRPFTPDELAAKVAELRAAIENEPVVFNEAARRVEEWTKLDAAWLAMQVHVPIIHLFARDDIQPAERPLTVGCPYLKKPGPRRQVWPWRKLDAHARPLAPPVLKAGGPEPKPRLVIDYETYASLMQLLGYVFVPLIIASAAGWLKKH